MKLVAYVGDAQMYHTQCLEARYTPEEIGENYDEVYADDDHRDDVETDDGTPYSCDICFGYIVEDIHPRMSVLARDILNLTVDADSEEYTRLCSEAAYIAREHDMDPETLMTKLEAWEAKYHWTPRVILAVQIQTMAGEWCAAWSKRTILRLHHNEDGALVDDEGDAVDEYDSRGFTDRYADGDGECSACGCGTVASHCYVTEWNAAYCDTCVTID